MYKFIALYQKPADPEAFRVRYMESHLPLVMRTPGVLRGEVSTVNQALVPGFLGDTELCLMAEFYFESEGAAKAAFVSPEWQAAGANLSEIGGVPLVAMFTAEVV